MEKKKTKKLVALILVVVAVIIVAAIALRKYIPSNETMSLSDYYGIDDAMDVALVVDNEQLETQGRYMDGAIYLPYSVVHEYINPRFYLDETEGDILYTTSAETISVNEGENELKRDGEKLMFDAPVFSKEDDAFYLSLDFVMEFSDVESTVYEDPDRVVFITDFESVQTAADTTKKTSVRYKGGIKSPVLTTLEKGTRLIIIEEGEDWDKVITEDGIAGYVRVNTLGEKYDYAVEHESSEEEYSHVFMDEPVVLAWHQVTSAYANSTLGTALASVSGVNVVSPTWFYINDNEGGIESYADSSYVLSCHAMGIQVWGLVSNLEDPDADIAPVLNDTANRNRLEDNLISEALECGMDGINIDFEALSVDDVGDSYIQFIRELSIKAHEKNLSVSIDVPVPSSYTTFYNRKEQAVYADYVIVMAYDEHYDGSDEGSTASISFVRDAVGNCISEGVPADQLVLGIPFYTRLWQETPKNSTADEAGAAAEDYVPYDLTSTSMGMDEAWSAVSAAGVTPEWDEDCAQYYAEYTSGDITYKVWLEDETSIGEKLQVMTDNSLAGVACWKLTMERPTVWSVINESVQKLD